MKICKKCKEGYYFGLGYCAFCRFKGFRKRGGQKLIDFKMKLKQDKLLLIHRKTFDVNLSLKQAEIDYLNWLDSLK